MATQKQSPRSKSGSFKIDGAPALTAIEEHKLRRENRELRHELDAALRARVMDQDYQSFVTECLTRKLHVPAWTLPRRSVRRHEVIPCTLLSDWHFDEVVRPEEIQHRNGYNRQIAEARLRLYFENVVKCCRNYVHGFEYPGIVVGMLGDMFSGYIHEELRRTNSDVIMGSLLHWIEPVAAGLRLLADSFGQVYVVSVVGNHGRNTVKPIAKMRARDNFDWLFAQLLARELAKSGEKRIHFNIGDGQKVLFKLYDTKFLASHGDEARGGSGIAGMLSPQLIAYSRMKKNLDFDIWLLGHWHTLSAYRGIRVNGSGKGYDEYAALNNFDFQRPMQDLFLVAPGHGVIASWPIFCQPDTEPWAPRSYSPQAYQAVG